MFSSKASILHSLTEISIKTQMQRIKLMASQNKFEHQPNSRVLEEFPLTVRSVKLNQERW